MNGPFMALSPRFGVTVLLLMLCFVLSHADRHVMGLLLAPIQRDLALSDTQLGLLQGAAFTLFYAVAGLPIARLLDNGNRVRIASACVLAWSLATMLCGLAGGFLSLAVMRALTATGEAGLPPAAFSLFRELGDRRRMVQANGFFMLAPFIGGGFALIAGGQLLRLLEGVVLPGWDQPWRLVFLLFGLPGIIMAPLLLLLIPETRQRHMANAGSAEPAQPRIASLFAPGSPLRFHYPGIACFTLFMNALLSWYPLHLVRDQGATVAQAGTMAGTTYLLAGIAGTLLATWIAPKRAAKGVRGLLDMLCIACLLALPVAVAMTITPQIGLSTALYGLYSLLSGLFAALMIAPIQWLAPPGLQARAVALLYLVAAISGSAGTIAIGLLTDHAGLTLGGALSLLAAAALGAAGILLLMARQRASAQA